MYYTGYYDLVNYMYTFELIQISVLIKLNQNKLELKIFVKFSIAIIYYIYIENNFN